MTPSTIDSLRLRMANMDNVRATTALTRTAIYARENHLKQLDSQCDELRNFADQQGYKVVAQFMDSGDQALVAKTSLTGTTALMKAAREGAFSQVLVWDISVFGNSMVDLIKTLNELESLKVGVRFVQQDIDTSSSDGAAITKFVASLAHFEKTLTSEKIRLGQHRAAANGTRTGRPTRMTESVRVAVKLLHGKGMGKKRIARELRIGVGSVIAAL